MFVLGILIAILGYCVAFAASIWFLVVAFRVSLKWGMICLIPFGFIPFVIQYWKISAKPFLITISATPIVLVGILMIAFSGPIALNQGSSESNSLAESKPFGLDIFGEARPAFDGATNATNPFTEHSVTSGGEFRTEAPRKPLPTFRYGDSDIIISEIRGTSKGKRFDDAAPPGGIIVGLQLGVDFSEGILYACPIFQVGSRCTYGSVHGKFGGEKSVLMAKPGYALGGLILTTWTNVSSVQAIFLKVTKDGKLDLNDRYLSEVAGQEFGKKYRVYGEGRPIVELFGFVDQGVRSFGLAALDPLTAPTTSPVVAVTSPSHSTPKATSAPPAQAGQKPANSFGSLPSESKPSSDRLVPRAKPEERPVVAQQAKPIPPSKETTPAVESKSASDDLEPFRSWSSSGGSFSVVAKLKSVTGNEAVLENETGKTVRVAIDKLSKADQEYLQARKKK